MSIPASIGGRATSHDEDRDEGEDALTPEFRKLLATVTREEVDRQPTRCPHAETAERMTKVGCSWVTSWGYLLSLADSHPLLPPFLPGKSASYEPKKLTIQSAAQSHVSFVTYPQDSVNPSLTNSKPCWRTRCSLSPLRKRSKSGLVLEELKFLGVSIMISL